MEENIQNQRRVVLMACYSIWLNKCVEYLHEVDEQSPEGVHWKICYRISI